MFTPPSIGDRICSKVRHAYPYVDPILDREKVQQRTIDADIRELLDNKHVNGEYSSPTFDNSAPLSSCSPNFNRKRNLWLSRSLRPFSLPAVRP